MAEIAGEAVATPAEVASYISQGSYTEMPREHSSFASRIEKISEDYLHLGKGWLLEKVERGEVILLTHPRDRHPLLLSTRVPSATLHAFVMKTEIANLKRTNRFLATFNVRLFISLSL